MFNLNTDRFKDILISARLLKSHFVAIIDSCLSAIKSLIAQLNLFRTSINAKLSYNGQVCSLERLLNDRFDAVNRDIFITDAESIDMLIAYEYLDIPKHIIVCENIVDFADYQVIAYKNEIIGDNLHKFIINVPNETPIVLREDELRALVNRYRLAGKLFYIIYF